MLASSPFALPTLEALTAEHEMRAIVTQPDRRSGRGGHLNPTPIGAWAARQVPNIPLLKPENINEASVVEGLRSFDADAWVVIAYGQKLGQDLLSNVLAINLHASLLPRWRGAAPIHASILAGDTHAGNTVITLADRMDAGLILAQEQTPIAPTETTGDLHDRLARSGVDLIQRVLNDPASALKHGTHQDESLVTRARKITSDDRVMSFEGPAELCRRRINAMSPRPGVRVRLADLDLRLLRAQTQPIEHTHPPHPAGTVLDADLGLIACAAGDALQILEIQPGGKRPMPWGDFARGQRNLAHARFAGGQ